MAEQQIVPGGVLTGLPLVDRAFHGLVADLQALDGLASEARQAVVEALPWDRRAALRLVDDARAAHADVAAEVEAFAAGLSSLDGPGLVHRWHDIIERRQRSLSWIPFERQTLLLEQANRGALVPPVLQRLLPARHGISRWSPYHEVFRVGEWLTLAHVVATCKVRPLPTTRLREYAELLDRYAAMQAEHERRGAPPPAAIAGFLLATGLATSEAEAETAVRVLDGLLPMGLAQAGGFGTGEDRADQQQDLRLHLMQAARELEKRGAEALLAGAYDGDTRLAFLPNAAKGDFLHQRAVARRRQELLLEGPLGEAPEPPRPDAAMEHRAVEQVRKRTKRLFPHTPTESRVLEAILTRAELDPRDLGYIEAVVQAVGCSRKTVSRYLGKLRKGILPRGL